MHYVTGVNTCFIHMKPGEVFFFPPRQVAVGTLLVFYYFFYVQKTCYNDNFQRNGSNAISVCLTHDFTAIMYCLVYIYMHVSRLNMVKI